ncbi:hypothetical protein [Gloeocapsopsis dulcis]|nr:hypothetical protein [Gloeocapsopsis dulcis]WNN91380.1 hypothetical protein P0S91_10045 [Gloeocapsopsis dulcis]
MNINDFNDVENWVSQQWGQAQLGDARRNQRAVNNWAGDRK